MNFSRLALGLSLPLFAIACASPTEVDADVASQEMTTEWLASNIPPGSALEQKVLLLVNDPTMTAARFQSECGYSAAQANNIVDYRNGDSPSASDDERFNGLAELDAVPFTDAPFWAKTVSCAMLHTPGPGACIPSPVVLEVVIDESGSMTAGGKWTATRDAVLGLFEKIRASSYAMSAHVGALGFSSGVEFSIAPRPMTQLHHGALARKVDRPSPQGGGTAIEDALSSAYNAVADTEPSAHGARRVVVLLTDGVPQGGETERQAALELARDWYAGLGIELYAVGIGAFPSPSPAATYDPVFMGELATAGGTAPAGCVVASTDPASICHVQVTPGAGVDVQLTNALDKIRVQVFESTPASACP